jgi:hypothetical protein|tara:strand:- start:219 stop:524 length:306 start_codon:yes stop_codon:yes gene_type:complete
MVVSACKNSSPTWGTNRVGNITVIQANTLIGNSINIWSFVDSSPIAANGSRGMIIGHDEDDIWFWLHFGNSLFIYLKILGGSAVICSFTKIEKLSIIHFAV